MPTVVSFTDKGIFVGHEARLRADIDPSRTIYDF